MDQIIYPIKLLLFPTFDDLSDFVNKKNDNTGIEIDEENILINRRSIILGARATGKTILLKRIAELHKDNSFYISSYNNANVTANDYIDNLKDLIPTKSLYNEQIILCIDLDKLNASEIFKIVDAMDRFTDTRDNITLVMTIELTQDNIIHLKQLDRNYNSDIKWYLLRAKEIGPNKIKDNGLEQVDINELTNDLKTRRHLQISNNIKAVLGVNELAYELSELIQNLNEDEKGNMIGIFGQWGRGKTFLMNILWNNLKNTNNYINIDFHAWKYQDTPAIWAYLYETFLDRYYLSNRKYLFTKFIDKQIKKIFLNFRRNTVVPLVKFSIKYTIYGLIIYLAINYLPIAFDKDKTLAGIYIVGYGILGLSLIKDILDAIRATNSDAVSIFNKYYSKHNFQNILGLQSEIQKELKILIKTWGSFDELKDKKIILFVDDIDRCNESSILSLIDALRVMLEDVQISKKVIVVSAIDERILKRAIFVKYKDLVKKESLEEINEIVKEYMDKIFISGIKLGNLTLGNQIEILNAIIDKNLTPEIITTEYRNEELEYTENITTNEKDENISENRKVSNVNKKRKNVERNFTLSELERTILQQALDINRSLTPRQIRIYYYRYLLARNLLSFKINILANIPKLNDEAIIKFLAENLIHYSFISTDKDLSEHTLLRFERKNPQLNYVEQIAAKYGKDFVQQIYFILEIVISY